jgi:hypothetical protein
MAAWMLLLIVPFQGPVYDRFDLLETNHFYDDGGKLVFTQLIVWEWCGSCHRVQAWRMLKDADGPWPAWSHSKGEWQAVWKDSGQGGEVIRCVTAPSHIETWTQHDRELEDRERFPQEQRRGFSKR